MSGRSRTSAEAYAQMDRAMAALKAATNGTVSVTGPVIGEPASLEDIASLMQSLGFRMLPDRGIGRSGALAFCRDEWVIWDAHPANYFKTTDDVVVPIDVIVTPAPPPVP